MRRKLGFVGSIKYTVCGFAKCMDCCIKRERNLTETVSDYEICVLHVECASRLRLLLAWRSHLPKQLYTKLKMFCLRFQNKLSLQS